MVLLHIHPLDDHLYQLVLALQFAMAGIPTAIEACEQLGGLLQVVFGNRRQLLDLLLELQTLREIFLFIDKQPVILAHVHPPDDRVQFS